MASTYNFKHQKSMEYKARHEPKGHDHTTFINYLWLGVSATNNVGDRFPCFVWKTIFLHLDSFETVYEFLINHAHRPNPAKCWYHSKDICCRTFRQGLTDFMYDSFGIIPIEIQFVPNDSTYESRDWSELNRSLRQMKYDIFYKPFPHSAKTSKQLLQHNTYWRRVIYVDYDYNMIKCTRNDWTLNWLLKGTSLKWGHIVNIIVRSDMLPDRFKPHTSDGVLDLPKLKEFHLAAISKLLEPEKSFNDDSFRMQYRFEIEERAAEVFNTKSDTFAAQQQLLVSLFRKAPDWKSLVKTFVSNSECQVNLNPFQSVTYVKKIPDPMDNGFLLNQYAPIVDLVIKCDSSMNIRMKKLTNKITGSFQKKKKKKKKKKKNASLSKYWTRLHTREDKLLFLQHCFPVYANKFTPIPKSSQPEDKKATKLKSENGNLEEKQEPIESTNTLETDLLSKPISKGVLWFVKQTKTVNYVKFRLQ